MENKTQDFSHNEEEVKKALYKKAMGYDCSEVVEEYGTNQDGDLTLTKKKVTKKYVGPDVTSLKLLLSYFSSINSTDLKKMTDKELMEEKLRLLELLKMEDNDSYGIDEDQT